MEYPFEIIESKLTDRLQFEKTYGTQPTHALFYLKSGNFTVEIDGTKQEISEGDCVIFPDYIHFRRNVSQKITFIYIKFAAVTTPLYTALPYGKIEFKNRQRFEYTISELEKRLDDDSKFAVNYRTHLLCDIILQAVSENTSPIAGVETVVEADSHLRAAHTYILDNIKTKISTDRLCRHCGTNASTLNNRFRKLTGMSTGMYINDLRMKRARKLLMSTTYSVKEIASRCGFDEVYYFSNAFKKHLGMSPSAYRKSL